VRYENVTVRGGPLTFADRGPLVTTSGRPLTSRISFADWDGDGREDVLTGQGHAGSFLRFYARGYLEDVVRGSLPRVSVEGAETRAR